MLSGLTYRWWASSSPKAAHTSLQWSASTGVDLLLGCDHHLGLIADEVQQRAEALDREQLGDVGPLALLPP